MKTYRYPALIVKRSGVGSPVVLFAAPCVEMGEWAGIPQKKLHGQDNENETVGFQRQENSKRVSEIAKFFSNPQNVIQNPILCASRHIPEGGVRYESLTDGSDSSVLGTIEITLPDFNSLRLLDLFAMLRKQLENRVVDFQSRRPSQRILETLKKALSISDASGEHADSPETNDSEEERTNEDTSFGESSLNDASESDSTSVLFEETHLSDFWEQVAARHEILKELGSYEKEEFLGFSRELLIEYLRPAVVVDGQHRLKGAIRNAEETVNSEEKQLEAQQLVSSGLNPDEVAAQQLRESARVLPVSLLLNEDPAEQVFQFVVVNQKATPLGKSLLGTIVSTTLADGELQSVTERLKQAGIPIEESKAISLVARLPASPFYKKVSRGVETNRSELIEWSVLGSLISIFKNLKGGVLYHRTNDFADLWAKNFLESSLLAQGTDRGNLSVREYWGTPEGPWLKFFFAFWSQVRDILADVDDPAAFNYWGCPRTSNLFNKITLTILAADFFKYLHTKEIELADENHVRILVKKWLTGVNTAYFNRDWVLSGVKKETPGIKRQWSKLWEEYRENPERLTDYRNFRNAASG